MGTKHILKLFRVDLTRDLNENTVPSASGIDAVQIVNSGGVYSVQGSLYPELEKLENDDSEVFFLHKYFLFSVCPNSIWNKLILF